MIMRKQILSLIFLMLSLAAAAQVPTDAILSVEAPDVFTAVFTTPKGAFTIEFYREWSPRGADRVFQLLQSGYYDNQCIFRVQKEYVVQFGIADNKEVNAYWDQRPIKDEPAKAPNRIWNVSFARDGADSRTTHLFINLKDNPKLDTITYNGATGSTPVGMVISGMEVLQALNGDYGFEPTNHQDAAMKEGNAYWNRQFPGLDYIQTARVLEDASK